MMTLDDFVDKFSEFCRKEKWALQYPAHTLRTGECWQYCPLTYLCKELTGHKYDIVDVEEAGAELDMSQEDIDAVVAAADNDQTVNGFNPIDLRLRLLKAAGLDPTKE